MVVSRVANLMPSRYREVAVTSVDLPLVPERLKERFLGREARQCGARGGNFGHALCFDRAGPRRIGESGGRLHRRDR